MKTKILLPSLIVTLFSGIHFLGAQELYTEPSAVSTVTETNSIGSIAIFNGSPSITTSNESDTGSHSILITNTNNNAYGRYRLQVPVTNGEQIRVVIKFKTENEAGTDYGNGFVWIEQGITTNTWTPSTQTGWQVFDEIVTTNASTMGLTFGPTQSATSVDKIWVDEVSVTPVNSSDTQSPSSPNLSSTGQSETTVDLSWSGATDNTGVTGYKIFKDGALEATLGNVNTYQVTGLVADTAYNFTVTALDAAGNESTVSNSVPVTTNASSGGGSSIWSESNSIANYTGDVAIGTTTVPSGYKLAVHGKIISEELKVQLQAQWPDYVFAENYNLLTLEEVQKYIKDQGHLPNIPSAKEVGKNGLEVGEMNRLLLEKIEELTLYILKQEQKIKKMNNKLNGLINQPKSEQRR